MRESRIAVVDRVGADTLTATMIAGSTTTVLKFGAVSLASWYERQVVNLTGTGATAENNKRVVQVTAVDDTLKEITVYPALDVAPAADDVLGGGWREWALTPVADTANDEWLHSAPLYAEHPAMGVLRSASDVFVIGIVAPLLEVQEVADLERWDGRIRVLGLNIEFAEGGVERVRCLLHAQRSAFTMPAGKVYEVETGSVSAVLRDDTLIEFVIPVSVSPAKVFA